MSIVTIGFSRARSKLKIGSSILQEVEKRDYSHCYVKLAGVYTDKYLIAQASHGMVNLVTLETFERENIRVKEYELTLNSTDYKDFIAFVFTSLGTPYSKLMLLLIAVKKLFKLQIKSYNVDKYYICSTYAAKVSEFCNVNIDSNLNYVTPSDLDTILSQIEGVVSNGKF